MPTTVTIDKNLMDATKWALGQFSKDQFQMETSFPFKSYTFKFKNPEDAVLFSLRWS